LKLSILDQSPISAGFTAKDALQQSMKLAQAGEEFGYTRYWLTEHHDLGGLASSAPEVVLGYIGAHTQKIKIGSGAILLPHYKPYKVAETFHTLATLFPNRIDLGIGRAPGGSAEASIALSGNFLENVWKMPELIAELNHFIFHDFPDSHPFSGLKAAPVPDVPPDVWLLGTSKKSALMAAENGTAYAFGEFMSDADGKTSIKNYKQHFNSSRALTSPKTLLAVTAICAETEERARELALSSLIWKIRSEKGNGFYIPSFEEAKNEKLSTEEQQLKKKMEQKMLIGTPKQIKQKLIYLQNEYETDEMMIITTTYSFEDKITSYRLLAEAIL
jgi:luciferase family oxidoreductase group 1